VRIGAGKIIHAVVCILILAAVVVSVVCKPLRCSVLTWVEIARGEHTIAAKDGILERIE